MNKTGHPPQQSSLEAVIVITSSDEEQTNGMTNKRRGHRSDSDDDLVQLVKRKKRGGEQGTSTTTPTWVEVDQTDDEDSWSDQANSTLVSSINNRGSRLRSARVQQPERWPKMDPAKLRRSSRKLIPRLNPQALGYPNRSKRHKKQKREGGKGGATSKDDEQHKISKPDRTSFQIEAQRMTQLRDIRQSLFLAKHRPLFLSILPTNHHASFDKLIQRTLSANNGTHPAITKIHLTPYRSVPQPKSIKGEMKHYQLAGLSFLLHLHSNGMNAILGDEMGLGKTLQTLSLLAQLKQQHIPNGQPMPPHLIICPLSVASSWQNEIKRWSDLTFCAINGQKSERVRITRELIGLGTDRAEQKRYDVILSTYECYLAEESWFKHRMWGYVVLDEGHRIKNHESLISKSLQTVRSMNRLILTGTPVQNNLIELWCLFHWLLPAVFTEPTLERFKQAFDLSAGNVDPEFLNFSHRLLHLMMLRRTKESVKGQLSVPPRREIALYLPLSACQRFWTKRLLLGSDAAVLRDIFGDQTDKNSGEDKENYINGDGQELRSQSKRKVHETIKYAIEAEASAKTKSYSKLMNLLMQLRKICNHPYLMPNSEPEPFQIAEHVVEASSKLVLLDKLLKSELPKGKRMLIFSGFTSMLDILEDFLTLRSIEFLRLDGSTNRARRNLSIRLFQQTMNDVTGKAKKIIPIFLISTKAGGLGINLTAADTVILYDSSWNPQSDIQAIARAHRIGQTKEVTVYRLITAQSVEQQMLGRLRKKLYLSLKIMDSNGQNQESYEETMEGETDLIENSNQQDLENGMPSMSTQDLCKILRGGASGLEQQWGKSGDSEEGVNPDKGYEEFLNSTFEQILEKAEMIDKVEKAKLEIEVKGKIDEHEIKEGIEKNEEEINRKKIEEKKQMYKKIEEEEIELFRGIESVRSRLFEGKKYKSDYKSIGEEWKSEISKRVVKPTITIIDGHAVCSKSITNERWQAVKTITSDPIALAKLSDDKRIKRKFEHQDTCLVCHDGGSLYLCSTCPRVAHSDCLGYSKSDLKKIISFTCSQHHCVICKRSTTDSGGMLYRCQTCSDAYCEDCLPEDNFYSVGEVLNEFLLLGYGQVAQAHWIRCIECLQHFKENPKIFKIWENEEKKSNEKLKEISFF